MGQNEGEDTQPHLAITTMMLEEHTSAMVTLPAQKQLIVRLMRQEMVVVFQVCSGVSPKARSHSLGTAGEPV